MGCSNSAIFSGPGNPAAKQQPLVFLHPRAVAITKYNSSHNIIVGF